MTPTYAPFSALARLGALVAVAVSLGGCFVGVPFLRPEFGPGDALTVTGGLLGTDGQPAAGQLVVLEGGRSLIPFRRETISDAQGRYTFTLRGSEALDERGTAPTLFVVARTPGGSSVDQAVTLVKARTEAAPMRLWEGLRGGTEGMTIGAALEVEIAPPPPGAGDVAMLVEDVAGAGPSPGDLGVAWQGAAPAGKLSFPAYRLKAERAYKLELVAVFEQYTAHATLGFKTPKDAAAKVLPIAAATDEAGTAYPQLFDGDLAEHKSGPTTQRATELVLDLGQARPIARLVGIGATFEDSQVFVAAERGAWGAPVATVGIESHRYHWDLDLQGRVGRYVRFLRQPQGSELANEPGGPTTTFYHPWEAGELRVITP